MRLNNWTLDTFSSSRELVYIWENARLYKKNSEDVQFDYYNQTNLLIYAILWDSMDIFTKIGELV